jgi:NADH:ubiquinone oxidoreductase subunit 6 (subunit J)
VVTSNVVRMAFYLIMSLGATSGLFYLAGADFVAAMQLLIYVGGTLVLLIFGVMLTAQSPFISMKTGAGEWILATIVGGSLLAMLLQTAFSVKDWQGNPKYAHALALVGSTPEQAPKVVIQAVKPGAEYAGVKIVFRDPRQRDAGKVLYNRKQGELTILTDEGKVTAREVVDRLAADAQASAAFKAAVAPGVADDVWLTPDDSTKTSFHGPTNPKTATALGLGLLGHRVDKIDQPDETLRRGMSGYLLPFEIVSVHLLVVLIGAAYLARTKRRVPAKA